MDFQKLQYLSLVNKVVTELDNNVGVNDRDLAEFIIDLQEKSLNPQEFNQKIIDNGAEFPFGFVENLFNVIQKMKPKKVQPKIEIKVKEEENQEAFKALSIPDKKMDYNIDTKEIKKEIKKEEIKKEFQQVKKEYQEEKKKPKREEKTIREPKLHHIYKAIVTSIKDFGFFAELDESDQGEIFVTRREGLCHISQIANQRVSKVSDFVKRGDKIWVKIIQLVDSKISLSMKEVDQKSGKDLKELDGVRSNSTNFEREEPKKIQKKQLTPQEMWELNQLGNSGHLDLQEHPQFDEEVGIVPNQQVEEDIIIERKDKEANFLKGQTSISGVHHEPMKYIKAPEGSLQRSALNQSNLAKERRELRERQKNLLLESVQKDLNKGWNDPLAKPHERAIAQELKSLGDKSDELTEWKKDTIEKLSKIIPDKSFNNNSKTIKEVREGLPVYQVKNELLDLIEKNQVVIVIGETGSGKTTQLTQYLDEAGYTKNGKMVGCTQPRRVAAISVSKRVSEEMNCKLGEDVGYCIRFEDVTSKKTRIKYLTDGMLLREALNDSTLSQYSVIILDEAHERSIHTDVLFGLTKKILSIKKDLKLIVTSATLEAEKFSDYYGKCPIFTIKGNSYTVTPYYTKEPESDYLDAALVTVMQIHTTEPSGDILLFLTGQEEIDTACQLLHEKVKRLDKKLGDLIILPIYSALPSQMQSKIFEKTPEGSRKVVIATNIAETSITLDGIYYVIDPGFVKQNIFNPRTGMEQLVVVPISQAAARQRMGRAGRTGPGKCFRLYTENAFKNEMLPATVPEIQRTNLGNVVLTLKAMGINDLIGFNFMDPPPAPLLIAAMEQLYALGALDDEGLLTKLGRKMAEFPLDPQLSKVLIASVELGCSEEVLTIVSMLSVESVFFRPKDKAQLAEEKKSLFIQSEGDHLTILTVYQAWVRNNYSQSWCTSHFVHHRTLKKAQEIRKQLLQIMDRMKLDILSCGKNYSKIRKAITSGFFMNSAKKDPQEGYKTLSDQQTVFIHPSSSLFNKNPEWVVYHTLILTSKEYMRDIIVIDPKWLVELAGNFFQFVDHKKKKVEKKTLYSKKTEESNTSQKKIKYE